MVPHMVSVVTLNYGSTYGIIYDGEWMERHIKIFEKALASPSNLFFEEACYLAVSAGFRFRRQKGTSHRIYKHTAIADRLDSMINIQEGDNGKAKTYQVKILLGLIEKYHLIGAENEGEEGVL